MVVASPPARNLRFGPYTADPTTGKLRRDGSRIPLQDKPFQILVLLAERPGELVTREELRSRLWPADTFVDFEHGLNTAVKKLRQALDDSAESPRYVETLPKRGYRFLAPVDLGPPSGTEEPAETTGSALARPSEGRRRRLGRVAVVALVAAAAGSVALIAVLGRRSAAPARPQAQPSLAVLPFVNLSGDPQDDYLAEGLTESLITELAKVPGLLVISRNGVLPYKGQVVDVRKAGSELRVGHVLEGSVQRSGGTLRVTAQLVDAGTGFHAWAEKYDRPSVDLFALQDEISGRVREALRLSLRPAGSTRVPTASLEAYDAYLRGRFHLHEARRTAAARAPDETRTAIAFLEKAVAVDPNFALAHAALGNAYATLFFASGPDSQWKERASVAIEKALALDEHLAEAYLARALLAWTPANGFPHEQAIADARRAVALDPSLIEACWMVARVYHHVGLLDEALAELKAADRLEPHNADLDYRFGMVFLNMHRYREALASFERIPEADRDEEVAGVLVFMGREREALALAEAVIRKDPRHDTARSVQAVSLARLGDGVGALRAIAEAVRLGPGKGHFHHTEHYIADAYASMGRKGDAVAWLRRAADHGFPCYPFFAGDPHLAGLKGDPAFEALMAEIKERSEGYRALAREEEVR
jgi:TolB-like protein/DNA-binding winged helix-turn-helix (wHTH) protein